MKNKLISLLFTKEKRDQWKNDKFVEKQKKETNSPRWSKPNYTNTKQQRRKRNRQAKRKY